MEGYKIKNNVKIIILILLTALLTLGLLISYKVVLFAMLFIFLNIYTLVKSSIRLLDNENLIKKLLEEDGINIVSKSVYKYNFITRFLFKIILKKIKRDLKAYDRKFEKDFNDRFNQRLKQEDDISECLKIFELDKGNELTLETIKRKYKNLARLYHPDLNKDMDDTKIKKINSCKDKLVRFIKIRDFK